MPGDITREGASAGLREGGLQGHDQHSDIYKQQHEAARNISKQNMVASSENLITENKSDYPVTGRKGFH